MQQGHGESVNAFKQCRCQLQNLNCVKCVNQTLKNRTKTTAHHTFCRTEVQAALFTTHIAFAPSVSYKALSFVVFVVFVEFVDAVASQSGSWHQFKGKAKRVSPPPIFTPVPSAVTRLSQFSLRHDSGFPKRTALSVPIRAFTKPPGIYVSLLLERSSQSKGSRMPNGSDGPMDLIWLWAKFKMFSRFGLPSQVENWGKNVSLLRWRSKWISSGFPYKAPCGKSLMLLELKSSCESFFSDEISGNVWILFIFSSKIFKFGILEKAFLGTSWIEFLLKSRSCRSGQYASVLKGHVSSPWLDRSITLWLQSTSISPAWSDRPSAWPSRFWSKRNESLDESSFSKQCWRSESAYAHAFKRKKPSSTIWSKIHFCSGPWHKNRKLTFAADTWPIRGFTRFNLGPTQVNFNWIK